MICLHDRNCPRRKFILIDIAVVIKRGWVIGGTELHFADGVAVQLEFTSAELRWRDWYMKSAEEGRVNTAEGANTKGEEKRTAKERNDCFLSAACTLHLSTRWSRICPDQGSAPGGNQTEHKGCLKCGGKILSKIFVCLTALIQVPQPDLCVPVCDKAWAP